MTNVTVQERRRVSIDKAMQHASKTGPAIFTGEAALAEVAKNNGKWDWALVGPDPQLPLSGGGSGGVEEMRGVIGKYPHSFGLLRMAFGVGDVAHTVFVFIHASDPLFSVKERSTAMDMRREMHKAVSRHAICLAKVRIQWMNECTVEFFVEKLRAAMGVANSVITMSTYEYYNSVLKNTALAQEEQEREARTQLENDISPTISEVSSMTSAPSDSTFATPASQDLAGPVQLHPPLSRAAAPTPEEDWVDDFAASLQRKKVKAYRVGDLVEIWSAKYDTWIQDAEVVDRVEEKCSRDGKLRAGSVKVVYNHGERFRWVPPHHVEEQLRTSLRLKAPDTMTGGLQKECHSDVTSWAPMHVEICNGYAQWWEEKAEARRGAKSQGHARLLGMQLWWEGRSFKLRADSTNGAIFAFRADTHEDARRWVHTLWEHAGHCRDTWEREATMSSRNSRKSLVGPPTRSRMSGFRATGAACADAGFNNMHANLDAFRAGETWPKLEGDVAQIAECDAQGGVERFEHGECDAREIAGLEGDKMDNSEHFDNASTTGDVLEELMDDSEGDEMGAPFAEGTGLDREQLLRVSEPVSANTAQSFVLSVTEEVGEFGEWDEEALETYEWKWWFGDDAGQSSSVIPGLADRGCGVDMTCTISTGAGAVSSIGAGVVQIVPDIAAELMQEKIGQITHGAGVDGNGQGCKSRKSRKSLRGGA